MRQQKRKLKKLEWIFVISSDSDQVEGGTPLRCAGQQSYTSAAHTKKKQKEFTPHRISCCCVAVAAAEDEAIWWATTTMSNRSLASTFFMFVQFVTRLYVFVCSGGGSTMKTILCWWNYHKCVIRIAYVISWSRSLCAYNTHDVSAVREESACAFLSPHAGFLLFSFMEMQLRE